MANDWSKEIADIARQARRAARALAKVDEARKNEALVAMAQHIDDQSDAILAANASDLDNANELGEAMRDRLRIGASHLAAMSQSLRDIAEFPAVVGRVSDLTSRPSGLRIGRMRVPIGVIAIIYESRPNVTSDAAGISLKSGNAAILRGGSEAVRSNRAIAECLLAGLRDANLPEAAIQLLPTTDRSAIDVLLGMSNEIDLIVPRGGRSLIEYVAANSAIPVLKHLDGVCHVYVDDEADVEQALAITLNAKTQRFGVCNALETLLVNRAIAEDFLPRIEASLADKGVELRACERGLPLLNGATAATEDDWRTEYLGPILAVRVVDDLDEALAHIEKYGSHHTDAIVTENEDKAQRFLFEVDSGSVIHNASTRFADGGEYGLGAEIGISTDKLHARGPVGVEGLTSQKYVVYGTGQVRS